MAIQSYDADWLGGGQTVMRDAYGRFANKAADLSDWTMDTAGMAMDALRDGLTGTFQAGKAQSLKLLDAAFGNHAQKNRNILSKMLDLPSMSRDPHPDLSDRVGDIVKRIKRLSDSEVAQNARSLGNEIAAIAGEISDRYKKKVEQARNLAIHLRNLDDANVFEQFFGWLAAEGITIGLLATTTWAPIAVLDALGFLIVPPVAGALGFSQAAIAGSLFALRISNLIHGSLAADKEFQDQGAIDYSLYGFRGVFIKPFLPWEWTPWADVVCGLVSDLMIVGMSEIIRALPHIQKFAAIAQRANKEFKNFPDYAKSLQNLDRFLKSQESRVAENLKLIQKSMDELIDKFPKAERLPVITQMYMSERVQKIESRMTKRFAHIPEFPELLNAANINLGRLVHEADIHIRAPFAGASKIVDTGFKTTFDTNSRPIAAYLDKRRRVEKFHFRLPIQAKNHERPIYGYLARLGKSATEEGAYTAGYGNVSFVLSREAKMRAALVGRDSFWAFDQRSAASPLLSPSVASFMSGREPSKEVIGFLRSAASATNLEQVRTAAHGMTMTGRNKKYILAKSNYIETSIFKGVKPQDIKAIFIDRLDDPKKQDLLAKLKNQVEKIENIRVKDERLYQKALKLLEQKTLANKKNAVENYKAWEEWGLFKLMLHSKQNNIPLLDTMTKQKIELALSQLRSNFPGLQRIKRYRLGVRSDGVGIWAIAKSDMGMIIELIEEGKTLDEPMLLDSFLNHTPDLDDITWDET